MSAACQQLQNRSIAQRGRNQRQLSKVPLEESKRLVNRYMLNPSQRLHTTQDVFELPNETRSCFSASAAG